MRTPALPFAGLVLAAVLTATLTGCGGGDDEPGADVTDGIAISTPTAVPTVTLSPAPSGKVKVTEGGLPPGFPAEIPLYRAPILAGSPGEPGTSLDWSVVLEPTGEPAAIALAAGKLLEDAGYAAGNRVDKPDLQVLEFANDAYTVGVTIARTGDGITMTYTVDRR